MDRDKVNRLAGILQHASKVFRSIDEPHVSATSSNNNSTTSTRTSTDSAAPSWDSRGRSTTTSSAAVSSGNSITETLSRARQMMTASSNSGLYRRLNRNERLRATASPSTGRPKKKAKIEKKPFEFALIKAPSTSDDEEEEQLENLKKENIIEWGIVELVEDDSEKEIRAKLLSSLKGTYSILGLNDFEFVKVTQKKITVLKMAEGAQYNYAVVKKLAGQGLLYIRIKKGYEFALKNPSESNTEDLVTVIEQVEQPEVSETNNWRVMSPTLHSESYCSSSDVVQPQSWKIDERYQTIINEFPSDINDTSEMLTAKILSGQGS